MKKAKNDVTPNSSDALDFTAQRLYFERDKREWSHHKLAEKSGLSSATLYNIERMIGCPTVTTIEKIAIAFGYTFQQFFSGETKKPPTDIVGRKMNRRNKRQYKTFDEQGNAVIELGRTDF